MADFKVEVGVGLDGELGPIGVEGREGAEDAFADDDVTEEAAAAARAGAAAEEDEAEDGVPVTEDESDEADPVLFVDAWARDDHELAFRRCYREKRKIK
jgi:hypothetical protein